MTKTTRCISCDRALTKADAWMTWFEIEGWEQPRQQGGTNHVALRERTGRVKCDFCLKRARKGLEGQGTLV